MATKPSWLDEEETHAAVSTAAVKIAKNPVAQKVAKDVAKDPKVQAAVKDAVLQSVVGEKPAWASDTPPPPPSATSDVENQKAPEVDDFECDPEVLKNMQRWHLALRLLYFCAAILLGAAGGYMLTQAPAIAQFFFAVYVLFFASMLCCFELGFKVKTNYLYFVITCLPCALTFHFFVFLFSVYWSIHRHQLWFHVHSDRTNILLALRRVHEFFSGYFRHLRNGSVVCSFLRTALHVHQIPQVRHSEFVSPFFVSLELYLL